MTDQGVPPKEAELEDIVAVPSRLLPRHIDTFSQSQPDFPLKFHCFGQIVRGLAVLRADRLPVQRLRHSAALFLPLPSRSFPIRSNNLPPSLPRSPIPSD